MCAINLALGVIFGAISIKHPIASGALHHQTPTSEIHLYSLTPRSENPGSAPVGDLPSLVLSSQRMHLCLYVCLFVMCDNNFTTVSIIMMFVSRYDNYHIVNPKC